MGYADVFRTVSQTFWTVICTCQPHSSGNQYN